MADKLRRQNQNNSERVVVEIFGITFPLRTDDPEKLQRLAADVDKRMKRMARDVNSFDGIKIAILTTLAMAHDYDELKSSYDEFVELLEER